MRVQVWHRGRYAAPLTACTFCGHTPAVSFALTACKGDPKDTASWRREVLPVCPRCHRLLAQAGDEGRKVKATGERRWLNPGNTLSLSSFVACN